MLERVRGPSSSPDSLERSTAKLLKHDSLSIYEATLLKLKQGSQQFQGSPTSEFAQPHDHSAGSSDCGAAMTMDCDCSCPNPSDSQLKLLHEKNAITVNDACILSSAGDAHVTVNLKQRINGDVSILHLFSKYKAHSILLQIAKWRRWRLIVRQLFHQVLVTTDLSETSNKNVSAHEQ